MTDSSALRNTPTVPLSLGGLVLEHLDCGIALLDATGKVCYWNKWLAQRTRIGPADALGRTLLEMFPELEGSQLSFCVEDALQVGLSSVLSQSIHKSPLPAFRLDLESERIPQQIQVAPILDPGLGRICILSVSDVSAALTRETTLHRANRELADKSESLKRAQELNRAVIEGAAEAILVFERDGRICDANPAAAEVFRYDFRTRSAKPLWDFVPAIREMLAQEVGSRLGDMREHLGVRGDGERFPLEMSVHQLEITSQELYTAIGRDISERKQSEDALQRSHAELQQFAYAASHDLQEPLRTISGFTGLLRKRYHGQIDAKADGYIDHVTQGVERMSNLIEALLEYSKVGSAPVELETVDTSSVVREALSNLGAALEESGAVVTSLPLPAVCADRRQLVRLFQNLIGNAIKFRRDDAPRIEIRAHQGRRTHRFEIEDNGIGVDPSFAERIFEVFQRLHLREEYPGTGIGLSICKRIVERHHGEIWMTSEPGRGSCFYFTLPTGV